MGLHKRTKTRTKHEIFSLFTEGDVETRATRIDVTEGDGRVYLYYFDGEYSVEDIEQIIKDLTMAAEIAALQVGNTTESRMY